MALTLSPQARRVLEQLGSGGDLGRSIERLAAEAVRLRLRQCVEALGEFEARYGSSFEQFAAAWPRRTLSLRRARLHGMGSAHDGA